MPPSCSSVLLALDGIADGSAAVESALGLAAGLGAQVSLRLVLDRAAVTRPEAVGVAGSSRFAHREAVIAERLTSRLDEAETAARERFAAVGVPLRVERLDGDARSLLPRIATRHDLVVLSNALRRERDSDDIDLDFALPVEELVRAVPRPFLLADREPFAEGLALVAYDGGRAAARTLHVAALLGLFDGRHVHVLTVADDAAEAEAVAQDAATLLARHGATCVAQGVADEDGSGVTAVVERRIEALRPALVVMGAFGERALKEWLFGSTTAALLERTAPAVLLQA